MVRKPKRFQIKSAIREKRAAQRSQERRAIVQESHPERRGTGTRIVKVGVRKRKTSVNGSSLYRRQTLRSPRERVSRRLLSLSKTLQLNSLAQFLAMYWGLLSQQGQAPEKALRAHTGTLLGDKMYVIGGCDRQGCWRGVCTYNTGKRDFRKWFDFSQ